MDDTEIELVRQTLRGLIAADGASLATLLEAGFEELRAEDEALVLGGACAEHGRQLSGMPILDLACAYGAAAPDGARPIFSGPRRAAAGRAGDGRLTVKGFALGDSPPVDMVVPVDRADSPWGSTMVLVASELLEVHPCGGEDPSLRLAIVRGQIDLAQARPLALGVAAGIRRRLLLCVAEMLLGIAAQVSNRAREHVLHRQQFGQPLGVFQVIQHGLAQVSVDIAGAEALLASAWTSDDAQHALAAAVQALLACEAAVEYGRQFAGAIGFTMEYGLQAQVRRYRALDALLGGRAALEARLGRQLRPGGLTAAPVPF